MTAREMFEELGYEYCISDTRIYYEKISTNKYGFVCSYTITFFVDDRNVACERGFTDSMCVDAPTLKAICKQFEELGWL